MMSLTLLSGCHRKSVNPLKPLDLSTVNIPVPNKKLAFLYLVNMNSYHMVCDNMVNKMPQMDNSSSKTGDIMTGYNVTAFLQPGTNSLDLDIGSISGWDGAIHRPDSHCQVVLTAYSEHGDETEISSLNITASDGKATAKFSKKYPDHAQSSLANISEGQQGWVTSFRRPFFIKSAPQWIWTKATPFESTPENMKLLHRAYFSLLELMKNRDFSALKAAYSLSSREKSPGEAGQSTPDNFFNAIGFESDLTESGAHVLFPQDWSDYSLKTYAGGKLVRLEDKDGVSPLQVENRDGVTTDYRPYFSLINGKIVLTR